jgi:hypothetical protein
MENKKTPTDWRMPGETLSAVLYGAAWCVIIVTVVVFLVGYLSELGTQLFSRPVVWDKRLRTPFEYTPAEARHFVLSLFNLLKSVLVALMLFAAGAFIRLANRFVRAVERIADSVGVARATSKR